MGGPQGSKGGSTFPEPTRYPPKGPRAPTQDTPAPGAPVPASRPRRRAMLQKLTFFMLFVGENPTLGGV